MRSDRAWWQVPMWSPRHLLVTCLVVLVLLFAVGRFQGQPTAAPGPASVETAPTATHSAEANTASATGPAPTPTVPSTQVANPSAVRAPATASEVAEAFVMAWSRRYDDKAPWRARVTQLSTPQFGKLLAKTDPLQVPATRSFGGAKVLKKTKRSRLIRVSTDAGRVAVNVVKVDDRWLVGSIQPVEQGR